MRRSLAVPYPFDPVRDSRAPGLFADQVVGPVLPIGVVVGGAEYDRRAQVHQDDPAPADSLVGPVAFEQVGLDRGEDSPATARPAPSAELPAMVL